jgi:hypothetical protein
MVNTPYHNQFFDRMRAGMRRSAEALVPIALELVGPRTGGRPLSLVHPRVWSYPDPLGFLDRLARLGVMTEDEMESKREAVARWQQARRDRRRRSGLDP